MRQGLKLSPGRIGWRFLRPRERAKVTSENKDSPGPTVRFFGTSRKNFPGGLARTPHGPHPASRRQWVRIYQSLCVTLILSSSDCQGFSWPGIGLIPLKEVRRRSTSRHRQDDEGFSAIISYLICGLSLRLGPVRNLVAMAALKGWQKCASLTAEWWLRPCLARKVAGRNG